MLQIEERRHLVLERWPKLAQPIFGGRTPEQAGSGEQYRNQILAAIWLLEVSDADTGAETYNALRKKLGRGSRWKSTRRGLILAACRWVDWRELKVETLDDEQLKQAFNRAMVANYVLALRRLAPEVVKRPTLPAAEYKLSAYRMLVRSAASSAEALATIEEARKFAESQKQSSAPWDLMELSFRIQRGEAPAVMQLIDHIQRQHAREPGVAQALVQLLMQTGLDGPDGRMAVDMGAGRRTGAAAEPGKLWTPDAPQAGGGEKKSARGCRIEMPAHSRHLYARRRGAESVGEGVTQGNCKLLIVDYDCKLDFLSRFRIDCILQLPLRCLRVSVVIRR